VSSRVPERGPDFSPLVSGIVPISKGTGLGHTGTMKTTSGGSAVKSGYYLSRANWEIVPVQHDGERLPGGVADHYMKVPLAVVFTVMPVLGGLMVVFLPFIGLALVAKQIAKPVAGLFHRSAQDLAATVTPGWAPGAAHFTGKSAEEGRAGANDRLDRLAKEIEERREAGKR